MPRPFLTARWTNLILLTYRLDPVMLHPFLPPGCTLDLLDGSAFASLVAFDFVDTRVLGIAWPGFIRFPEINLRFYVRFGPNRGVCFAREFVPQSAVARLARWFYNEPYKAMPMTSQVTRTADSLSIRHNLTAGGRENRLSVIASNQTTCPAPGSIECFFKEHEWGFGVSRRGKLIQYQVLHPVWNIHEVRSFELDWDWQAVYGPYWAPLQQMQPMSVLLAQGSAVKVFPRAVLPTEGHLRQSERPALVGGDR